MMNSARQPSGSNWGSNWAKLAKAGAVALPMLCLLLAALLTAPGCTMDSSDRPTSRPGETALKDPMNYKAFGDEPNISGGGISNFDKKAFKRDIDDFFNP